jgi:hypothetical protein
MLGRLLAELRDARAEFDVQGLHSRPPVVRSLRAVLSFLTHIYEIDAEGMQVPLGHLLAAVQSLDEGKVTPLLKPAPPRGRSSEGLAHDTTRALAAHFVTLLAPTGTAQRHVKQARTSVAGVLWRAGMRPTRGAGNARITERTVRGWCETLTADVGCKTRAGHILANLRASKFCCPPDGAVVAKKDLLRAFAEALTALRGKAT